MKHIIISIVVICMLISSACAVGELKDSVVVDKTKETLKEIDKGISVRDTSADIAKYDVLKEKDKITISKTDTVKDKKIEHTKTKLVMDEKTARSIDVDNDGKFGYMRKVDGQVVESKTVTLKELTAGIQATFSEVIVDGFSGHYTKTGSSQEVSESFSLGQSFASNNTSAVTLNISTTAYSDPYTEIAALNPVAWYKFDNTSGTTIIDSSGNGYNGVAYNGPTWVTGKYNNGMKFDGVNDYVSIPYNSDFNITGTGKSWIFIIKPNVIQTDFAKLLSAYYNLKGYHISIRSTGELFMDVRVTGGTNNIQLTSTKKVNDNRWHVVISTINTTSKTANVYIDGAYSATDTYDGAITSTATYPISIGYYPPTNVTYFKGVIDTVGVVNRPLTTAEIQIISYDNLQQLQARTNANATYSPMWNSTSNNPLTPPVSSLDGLISSIQFKVPQNVTQNGVTIYNYNQTVAPFTPTASILFTDDITEVTDSHTALVQTVNITHTSTNTADNGSIIPYEILDGYDGTAIFQTNNTNASISQNETHFIISTGYVSAGSTYYYLVEIPTIRITGYTPTNNNVSNLYDENTLYTVHVSEASDIVWKIDNSTYKTVSSVTSDSLNYGSTFNVGMHNITANIINSYGDLTDSNTWNVDVYTNSFENMGNSLTDDINESYLLMGTLLISLMGITILIILYGSFTGKIDIPLALMAVLVIIISSALMVISIIMLNALIELI